MLTHSPSLHPFFELLAYFVGFRWFLWERKRLPNYALAGIDQMIGVVIGAILGAVIGAKLLSWGQDPVSAFADFPVSAFASGKTIVGALLGGWVGVEIAKRLTSIVTPTGDAMGVPILVGIAIGRVGCFLAGLSDDTHGVATALPWGHDYGDGIARHPTQIYEMVFVVLWALWLTHRRARLVAVGDLFKAALAGYLVCRLTVDSIKPIPVVYLGFFSAIQLACITGLIALAPHSARLIRGVLWARK
jgi:phosphatidylglycerol:prolipoprotein diacylglycerol transferase